MYYISIIDDHPLINEAYVDALEKVFSSNPKYQIKKFNDIDSVLMAMRDRGFIEKQDLILLDIRLPPSESKKIISGEGLGMEIINSGFKGRLIISTTLNDNYRLYSILKNLDPDGFLVKNDVSSQELINAINCVMNEPPYYSKSILQLLRKQISNDFVLDKIDRQLLYELASGAKTKDLPSIIPLSIAGVERRKRSLKIIFNVENEGDKGLVRIAKERGFI